VILFPEALPIKCMDKIFFEKHVRFSRKCRRHAVFMGLYTLFIGLRGLKTPKSLPQGRDFRGSGFPDATIM